MWARRIAVFVLLFCSIAAAGQSNQDPAVKEHLRKGQKFLNRQKYEDAIDEFKMASKKAQDKSFDALMGLALAYQGANKQKDAIDAARRALPLASSDAERADVHSYMGVSYLQMGATKSDYYKQAESEFRTVLQLVPTREFGHYNLGMALLKQSRDAEGQAEMKLYVEQNPKSARVNQAKQIIANPRRAREFFIPEFTLVTLDGERINSSELQGKVIVLDFWATWCTFCKQSVPELRRFAKYYEGRPVVLISISADTDENAWRSFVQENEMKWPQSLDSARQLGRVFGVQGIPAYFVIDGEGVIREKEVGGTQYFKVAKVANAVNAALKQIEKAQDTKTTAAR